MLIGGPNQSHKVNFKERFPKRERVPRHRLPLPPSIPFSENFSEKICRRNSSQTGFKSFLDDFCIITAVRLPPRTCAKNSAGKRPASVAGRSVPPKPHFCIQIIDTKSFGRRASRTPPAHSTGSRSMRFCSGGWVEKMARFLFIAASCWRATSAARRPPGA